MLLNLIAQVAGPDGSAGPWVRRNDGLVSLRDWLCDALTPMAQRGPRSITLAERVESDLARNGLLPGAAENRRGGIAEEMRARVRTPGKSNPHRPVPKHVNAGPL